MIRPVVIKISGHRIDEPDYLVELAQTLASMQSSVIVIHGGGKEITQMQEKLGIVPQHIDGVRITDEVSLSVVTMVLCGTVNKRLVSHLISAGLDAQGLSGVDRGIVRATRMHHPEVDMGFTGEVSTVRGDLLLEMLENGITPVLSPVSLGEDSILNVNGDHVAGAVAAAVNAQQVIFLSNVEGVLDEGQVVSELTEEKTQSLIESGVISGGMIPKVQMALHTLSSGVGSVAITNLKGLQTHGGTLFTQATSMEKQ